MTRHILFELALLGFYVITASCFPEAFAANVGVFGLSRGARRGRQSTPVDMVGGANVLTKYGDYRPL
jgi:hypothetical protein